MQDPKNSNKMRETTRRLVVSLCINWEDQNWRVICPADLKADVPKTRWKNYGARVVCHSYCFILRMEIDKVAKVVLG